VDGLTPAEADEYWETIEALVASNGIQGMEPEEPEIIPGEPEPASQRLRDTDLVIQSPSSSRRRDTQLPRRKSTP
jgi:hypothetical protein